MPVEISGIYFFISILKIKRLCKKMQYKMVKCFCENP